MAEEAACEPVSRWENAAMRLWLAVRGPSRRRAGRARAVSLC